MNYRELRLQKGLSQVKAARAVGVTLGTWLKWEYGVGSPNAANASKIKLLERLPDRVTK